MSSETQLTTETKQATSEAETWPKVAIIVLNWNGWKRIFGMFKVRATLN